MIYNSLQYTNLNNGTYQTARDQSYFLYLQSSKADTCHINALKSHANYSKLMCTFRVEDSTLMAYVCGLSADWELIEQYLISGELIEQRLVSGVNATFTPVKFREKWNQTCIIVKTCLVCYFAGRFGEKRQQTTVFGPLLANHISVTCNGAMNACLILYLLISGFKSSFLANCLFKYYTKVKIN